jgi:CRISPR/Cas system-associated exonuclease Cas4 (RecB family)
MSEAQEFNPFNVSEYSNTETQETPQSVDTTGTVQTAEPVAQEQALVATQVVEMNTEYSSTPTETQVESTEAQQEFEPSEYTFEWPNEVSKDIYEKLINGDISELADMIYEQKVLSNLDDMSEADLIKLKMAYEYPDLTPEEIEDEFNSKFSVDEDFDESLLTEDEIASKRKQIEKQRKSIGRELKKEVREAKDYLSEMKQEISFPDILSQVANTQQYNPEDVVNQYLAYEEEEQFKAHDSARKEYLNSISEGLKSFDGFNVSYKDEDVSFDGKYSLTPEDKAALTSSLNDFDLDDFYGNRYYKDGKYDAKQLAEDVYFLQNRDKIINAMVTQAVSRAKMDILKSMKNVDYNDSPRVAASAASTDDYSAMVAKMFSL